MSGSGSSERRAFFRLRYPEAERPKLLFDNMQFEVVELSESGLRIDLGGRQLETGRTVLGWVRFRDYEANVVEGAVLRTEGQEAVVLLSLKISLKRMLDEQRRLIKLYPMLFERSEADARPE
jgi:hypothetical protein